jgi:2-keto-4-pentenoate hydratase/2-oxohepta-3-ene-1,7-dioic acid hydratase in catechol pathway
MDGYRLLSFRTPDGPKAGVLIAGNVHDARQCLPPSLGDHAGSVRELLDRWDEAVPALALAAQSPPAGGRKLAEVELLAPVLYPGNVIFVGANYWDHIAEMNDFVKTATGQDTKVEKLPEPWVSMQTSGSSIVGPDAVVEKPPFSNQLDWEAEVALVVGRPAKNLDMETAFDCLAGYTIANDLSLRDYLKKENHPFIYDWFAQKSFDGSMPIGPWITPREAIGDPHDLAIRLWVNDNLMQDSSTRELVHDFREILVYLSAHVTLQPGDVIATGTPAGVGLPKGVFLSPGDIVRIEIEGLGELTTKIG